MNQMTEQQQINKNMDSSHKAVARTIEHRAKSIDCPEVNPENIGQIFKMKQSLEKKMVKYQYGFEHLNKVCSQNQIDDDDCVGMETVYETRTIPNEVFLKEKIKTPSVSQIRFPFIAMKRRRSIVSSSKTSKKSLWITSDIEDTEDFRANQIVQSNVFQSESSLEKNETFEKQKPTESLSEANQVNGPSFEINSNPVLESDSTFNEIELTTDDNKENEDDSNYMHGSSTVTFPEINRNIMSESTIQHTNPTLSRDNRSLNDDMEEMVPKYVKTHPLFTKKKFQFVECTGTDVVIAKCSKCNENKKGYFRSISNFIKHYKRKHPEIYVEFENSVENGEPLKPSRKSSIVNKKGVVVLKKDVECAINRFIIQDMQPFIRTESAAFQNLIAVCLGYSDITELPFNIMSERTIKRRICDMYAEHVKNVEKILSKQRWFCLTMDIWSCKNRSFLGVSIHYIDEQTLERKSFVLCCEDFPSPHTHEYIAERLQILYSRFSLKPSSIVASVTDNGSNFVCAFKVFGRGRKEAYNFFEELKNAYNENDDEDVSREPEVMKIINALNQLSHEMDQRSVSDLEDEAHELYDVIDSSDKDDNPEGNLNNSRTDLDSENVNKLIRNEMLSEDDALILPNRIPCNTHTLNLIGGVDSLAAYKNKTFAKKYENVFEKLNLLWYASGRQSSSEIIKKCLGRNLNKPNKTRWNWLYDRMCEILRFDAIKLKLTMMSLEISPFTDSQRQFLLEYKSVLKPIANALDNLQQSKAPYGIVLPTIYDLNKKLKRMMDPHSEILSHCKPLLNAVWSGFNKRLGYLFKIDDEKSHAALIATVTHPFFKLRWISFVERTPEYIDRIINILVNAAYEILLEDLRSTDNARPISRNSVSSETSPNEKTHNSKFQYTFYDDEDSGNTTNLLAADTAQAKADLTAEITRWLKSDCSNSIEDLTELKMFSKIKSLYLKFNVIMPSESDIERIFSFGGITMRPHRRHMNSDLFEKVIILKSNCYSHRNDRDNKINWLEIFYGNWDFPTFTIRRNSLVQIPNYVLFE